MTTLALLAADVYTITNRPDLTSETRVALRKAIYKCHLADTFSRDLGKTRIQTATLTPVQPNQFRYQLDLTDADLFPRFRRLSSINYPVDLVPPYNQTPAPLVDWASLSPDLRNVRIIASDNLFDSYKQERTQYAAILGSTLDIKLSWGMDYIDIYFYQFPGVPTDIDATITSWIADQYPDAVIEEACASVFKMIGKDDESARYTQLFMENMAMIKAIAVGEDAQ